MPFKSEAQREGFFSKYRRGLETAIQERNKKKIQTQTKQLAAEESKLTAEIALRKQQLEQTRTVEAERSRVNALQDDLKRLKQAQFEHSRAGQLLQSAGRTFNRVSEEVEKRSAPAKSKGKKKKGFLATLNYYLPPDRG